MLFLIRLYVGWQWLVGGYEKVSAAKPFNAGGFMKNIIVHPVVGPDNNVLYPFYNHFISNVALPHAKFFSFLVAWGELLVGLGLILGVLTTAAAFFGLLMNFIYLFGGTVSTNPELVFWGAILLFSGFNAGKIGGDYWIIPWIRHNAKKWFHHGNRITDGHFRI